MVFSVIASITALIIAFVGVVGTTMMAILGYFLRNFHSEYKADKVKAEIREEKMDAKIQSLSETWGRNLSDIVDKIGQKINELPNGSKGLSDTMLEHERSNNKRFEEHAERISDLRRQLEEHRSTKLAASKTHR